MTIKFEDLDLTPEEMEFIAKGARVFLPLPEETETLSAAVDSGAE